MDRQPKRLRIESDSDSDVESSAFQNENAAKSESDGDSTSSDSSVGNTRRRLNAIISDSDTSSSESDWDISPSTSKRGSMLTQLDESSSSESDGQSDKCPICLVKFKGQEIASPNSCEHNFCFECILEWSKNVTTCPVDRKQFSYISVKGHLDGGEIRQVPVESMKMKEEELPLEDPTYCEICHSCEREDCMLLCDGCDLGYHMDCLTPPMHTIPMGNWLCPECGPEDLQQDQNIYVNEVEVMYRDASEVGAPSSSRRQVTLRTNVVPRTRQSDRIRARILSNRQQSSVSATVSHHNIQVTVNNPSTSGLRTSNTRSSAPRKRRKKRKKKTTKSRISISYEVDEATGQKIVIETRSGGTKRRKKKKRKNRRQQLRLAKELAQSKTTKRRLAKHFGICAPRAPGQTLPDVRATSENTSIGHQRYQAGIVGLSLFGNPHSIEYFSDADGEEEESSVGSNALLTRRRPNLSDAVIFRRAARRKSRLLEHPPQQQASACTDILGSIMSSQEQLLAKNAVLSLNKDGSLKIDTNKNNGGEQNRNRINVNDVGRVRVRATPGYTQPEATNTTNNSQEFTENRTVTAAPTISNNSVSTSSGEQASNADGCVSGALDVCANDAETVTTSKVGGEDSDVKPESPMPPVESPIKEEPEIEPDLKLVKKDAQEEDVSSTTNVLLNSDPEVESDDEECPNFSIYSKDTINLVANRNPEQDEVGSSLDIKNPATPVEDELEPPPHPEDTSEDEGEVENCDEVEEKDVKLLVDKVDLETPPLKPSNNLYSDSDEEVKVEINKSFGIGDIRSLTEDISEEERSYTPCLDERVPVREGLEGLDTEAISEDEKNDFDESQEQKAVSDAGDALEINAKESEMDFTKPEDYEEGEIIDKLKKVDETVVSEEQTVEVSVEKPELQPEVEKEKERERPTEAPSFKKISKSTKDRNYRDKERRSRSHSKEKNKENERDSKRERKREKRKELERYNVRNVVSEKPRKPPKDKFGRDARRRSTSRSSRSSCSPYKSDSPRRRSSSRDRQRRKRRSGRTRSHTRSRKRSSSDKRRDSSKSKRKKKSRERSRKKNRSSSRHRAERAHSSSSRRQREWGEPRQRSRAWTPSLSRSRSPERHLSPSWTPPRIIRKKLKPRDLTVILTNDSSQKKEKRSKGEKRKGSAIEKAKKRKRDRTPAPSKEVFASGDNILVSVSFNKEIEELSKRAKQREERDEVSTKRTRKEKDKYVREETVVAPAPKKKKKKSQDLAGVKPVAIIDLDRSPFKELTPSPKDVIVLSDSDHSPEKAVNCDSSQQVDYALGGPKTPPEPQVKFSLTSKLPQIRQINNPLHEPDDDNDEHEEIDPQAELEQRLNEAMHKGPFTPSDPPDSPPSSPDAYDPFDPTKSRSPTPVSAIPAKTGTDGDGAEPENIPLSKTPEAPKSHTPPLILTDIQPADSQTNAAVGTPEEAAKSGAQLVPQGSPIYTSASKTKSGTPTLVYSSANSTPTSVAVVTPKVNILTSTIIPSSQASQQQRGLPAGIAKGAPLKPSPTKASLKMMPKRSMAVSKPAKGAKNRSTDSNDSNMDLDSPYSPGPSDFEDLFEPPTEHKSKGGTSASAPKSSAAPPSKPAGKIQNTFDNLFGSPPSKNKSKIDKNIGASKRTAGAQANNPKCKQVGVKVDEDSLKILDELPNSAVEMQVKDKFLKKLNRQERVVEEVKLVLKPHYNKKHINKDEYKDILRRAVPKICHNKSGEINPKKIQNLIEAYVKKFRHSKKVSSSSSVNVQK